MAKKVRAKQLDTDVVIASGANPFTSDQSLGGHKLTNVADPTNPQDGATKNYVDSVAQGLDVKQSVRVATTANITLSGTQTIDGVAVVAGDRVLVKDQTTGANNGIYVCAAGAWTRATDADTSAKVTSGLFTFIEEGTSNGDTGWVLTTNNPITLGTTALTFVQFSGGNTIVGGAGLVKTGNTLNVVANADGSMVINADDIQVGVLATDAQHGNRGGGALHAVATGAVAGFMSAADKTKLDGLPSQATETIRFTMTGKVVTGTGLDVAWIAPRACTITRITLYRRTAGSSGSTTVDVNKNGTTVFTTQANRPSVTQASGNDQISAKTNMDVTSVAQDDRIEFDVDAAEGGNPRDIAVIIEVKY